MTAETSILVALVLPLLGGKVLIDKGAGTVMPMLPHEGLRGLLGEAAAKPGGGQ